MKQKSAIKTLLQTMARLRAPDGCPWDREQDHSSLRFHAVEEVYELMDAIEAGDDVEMIEELGDVLLQVVFHCQLGSERGAFDFDSVCERISQKLVHRHPHVFGKTRVKDVAAVWAQWEKIKRAEKLGTRHERPSALDGIPKHLPSLLRAEKLVKKARRSGLSDAPDPGKKGKARSKADVARELFELTEYAQSRGWSAEALLRSQIKKTERVLRRREKTAAPRSTRS